MGKHILLALTDSTKNADVVKCLNSCGADISRYSEGYSKQNVREFCQRDDSIDVVLVSEYLAMNSPYTVSDLSFLDEVNEHVRIIPIISDERKGTSYVSGLFSEAIYNAVFESDAGWKEVAHLIAQGRTKKEARAYYGIRGMADMGAVAGEGLEDIVAPSLKHVMESANPDEMDKRLNHVKSRLTTAQFTFLMSKLPADVKMRYIRRAEYAIYFSSEEIALDRERVAKQREDEKAAAAKNTETISFLDKLKKKKDEKGVHPAASAGKKEDEPEQIPSAEPVEDTAAHGKTKSSAQPIVFDTDFASAEQAKEVSPRPAEKTEKTEKQDEPELNKSVQDEPVREAKESKPSKKKDREDGQKQSAPSSQSVTQSPSVSPVVDLSVEQTEEREPAGEENGIARDAANTVRDSQGLVSDFHISSGAGGRKRVIGVVGLSHKAGSTFVAMNIARMFAQNNVHTTFVQLPGTNDNLFSEWNYRDLFGYEFVQHMRDVFEGRACPKDSHNTLEGVDFVLDPRDDRKLMGWKNHHTMRLLMGLDGTVVLDLGTYFSVRDRGREENADTRTFDMLEECSDVVVVLNVKKSLETAKLRELKGISNKFPDTKLHFVLNFSDDVMSVNERVEAKIGDGYNKLYIPAYDDDVMYEMRNGFLYPYFCDDSLAQLGAMLDVKVEYKQRGLKRKARAAVMSNAIEQGAYIPQGTVEIAFAGATHGCGVTHTAFMCANALSSDYKVAFFEANGSCDLRNFYQYLTRSDVSQDIFSWYGVDFYARISYQDFSTKYKNNYDFVIVDYGVFDEKQCANMMFASKRVMVVDSCEWKRKTLIDLYHKVESTYDAGHTMQYLVARVVEEEDVSDISKACCNNSVRGVPFCYDAFGENDEAKYLFRSMLGMGMRKRGSKKGLFGKLLKR